MVELDDKVAGATDGGGRNGCARAITKARLGADIVGTDDDITEAEWGSLADRHWQMQVKNMPFERGRMPADNGEAFAFLTLGRTHNNTGASLSMTAGLSVWRGGRPFCLSK